MIPKLDDLKDRTKYKRLLKTELQAVKANPEVWVLFDKFQFNDKVAPLLLVGDMASKVPFDAVKDTDAPIKGKGKCAKQGDDVVFAAQMGSIPLDKLTDALGGVSCKVVKSLAASATAIATDEQLKAAAEAKLALSERQFNAIKGRVSDSERKDLHKLYGGIAESMEQGKYGQAITQMQAVERLLAQAGKQLRDDAQQKEDGVVQSLDDIAAKFEKAAVLAKQVQELTEDIKKTENSKNVQDGRKGKQAQQRAAELGDKLKQLKPQLVTLQKELDEAAKSKTSDQAKVRELNKLLKSAHDALSLGTTVQATVGKLADNPELLKAQQDISAKVGKMSEAVKWQQDQVKKTESGVNTHGTGRHGAQTGLAKQAQRVSSDVTPDQPHNEGGTARIKGTWKTHKIDIVKTPQGKEKLEKPAQLVTAVIDEMSRTFAASTSSLFLNPVLEKEAVDRALAIANQAKDWTQWQDGTTWKPLTSLTVVVPPPAMAGLQVGRADGFVKKTAAAAAALVKDFDNGKIKTVDELFKKLDVQLVTDRTGVGAALVPHARVVLERASSAAAWSSKTYFPTSDPVGWECAKGVDLANKQVRGNGIAARVAGNFTR
jgi:hypothetical protein